MIVMIVFLYFTMIVSGGVIWLVSETDEPIGCFFMIILGVIFLLSWYGLYHFHALPYWLIYR